MRTAQTVLTVIQERGKQHKPIERVYKLLFNRDFYLNAYAKLYPNNGAMTKGVTDETVDGMSIQKIDRMIELLREEKYQWKPARREYIPKKNGKKRPLGIPTWGDKLLQEVMREILEAYYEPQFSNHSHGFRPNRGCHTALQEIQIWKGTRWFIEGDISKYFDTIDHDVLLKILEKNIHDGRFLRLISNMLKAGYLDDWKFNQTISGTPQGGVISPLLANIYLNEFDQWIENTLIPQYTKGKRQKSNPVYNRMNAEISKARKNGDMQTAHKLEVERRNIPSVDPYDENYRRCRYVRYADDFLIGFTGSKADAEEIKAAMHNFLENELHLELSQEKTLITNASSQAAKFLGYEIKAQRANDYIDPKGRRGANGAIALFVPAKVIESKCQSFKRKGKVTHRNELLQEDDFSIVQQFQAEYRGLIQYYILAQNLSWFSTLYWVMETSLLKTLACKHRSSMKKQKKKYRTTTTSTSGKEVPCLQVVVPRPSKKPLVATWGGISLVHKRKAIIEDKPYKVYPHSAAYASEHGEMAQYNLSYQANSACKEAIEQTISAHYAENRLDTEAAIKDVLEKFGAERVQFILANTIQHKNHDGRISQDNKAWAKTIPMPEDSGASRHCAYLVVDGVNPGLTDLFTRQARKTMQEQQKSSVLQKLKQEPPAHKPAAPKKQEPER